MKNFFKESEPEKKEIQYLKNTILFYKMLKEVDIKEIPKYKLELANQLNKMDIFLFKLRLILSVVGIIGSLVLILIILNSFFSPERNSFNILYVLYLYLFVFVGMVSYRVFKRILFEIRILAMMIED